jgi:hypothetical protein
MDPNETLKRIMKLTDVLKTAIDALPEQEEGQRYYKAVGELVDGGLIEDVDQLATDVDNLVEWLAKGGFSPNWKRPDSIPPTERNHG